MKLRGVLLASIALAGCASTNVEISNRPDDECAIVAEQRMRDGALNGYDPQLQKAAYEHTYADCVRWNAAHSIR
jgi:hypothetical protein